MMTKKTAVIHWTPADQGGRKAPPVGPRYVAPAKFMAAAASWPNEAWSLVADLVDSPDELGNWQAEVHFLMDNAPHHLLLNSAEFEFYEGKRCVGHGKIVG